MSTTDQAKNEEQGIDDLIRSDVDRPIDTAVPAERGTLVDGACRSRHGAAIVKQTTKD